MRALGVAFQPNVDRPTFVGYEVSYGSGGVSTAYVELLSDVANPPTTPRARVGGATNVAIVVGVRATLNYVVPPGHYVLLQQVDVVPGGVCTLGAQVEVSL